MTNHPLNSVRYADLVGMLRGTIRRLNDYLDVAIELKKMELEDKIEEREQELERQDMEINRDLYIDYAAEMDMAQEEDPSEEDSSP